MSGATDISTKRLHWVTLAQLISMLIIVFAHSIQESTGVPAFFTSATMYLQYAGLTVFMWTSGYLAAKTNPLDKYGYCGYIQRRAIRLLVPYFAISLIMLIPKYLLAAYASTKVSMNPLFVLKQLATPREGILPHLWFLPTLMIFSLALPVWRRLLNKPASICLCILVLGALQFIPNLTNILCINDVLHYALWFFVGMVAAEKIDLSGYKAKIIATLAIVPISAGYALVLTSGFSYPLSWLLYRLLFLIIIIMISIAVQNSAETLCRRFGKYSFAVYIMSLPVQNIMHILFQRLGLDGAAVLASMFLAGVFIPYAVACAVNKLEQKSKRKILSTIIGV